MGKKPRCPMLVRKCACGRFKCIATTPSKKIFNTDICTGGEHKKECLIFLRKHKELKKKLAEPI